MKDMAEEQPDGRDALDKVWGKGRGASMPSLGAPLSQHLHVFTNPEALQIP